MKIALRSTSYWATVLSIIFLGWIAPRLEEAHLLLACVAATYFVGRGITQVPKVPTTGFASSEFSILCVSIAFLANGLLALNARATFALCVLVGSYNIGRGLANYYRSKVSMVLNR